MRLLEVTRQLARPCDLGHLLEQIIEAGRAVLRVDRGSVFLYDEARRELFALVATGGESIRFGIDRGIAGETARTRRTIVVPDCYADPRFNPDVDRRTGYRTRCLASLPLIGLDDQLVGVLQLLNPARGSLSDEELALAEVLASQAAAAIQRTRLLEERVVKVKLERDLDLARDIQRNVLPGELPVCRGYTMAGFNQPADQTGGDVYDVALVPEEGEGVGGGGGGGSSVLLVLADATGHGIGPALSITQFRAMLRMGLRLGADLDRLVDQCNRQVCADLPDSRFITAFVGLLDPSRHELRYHAPGQGPLGHWHAETGVMDWLGASMPPLGVIDDFPVEPGPPMRLERGDVVVLLTDGFFEYRDAAGTFFGTSRVEAVVRERQGESAGAILDAVIEAVRTFAGGMTQLDDLTAIVVKREA